MKRTQPNGAPVGFCQFSKRERQVYNRAIRGARVDDIAPEVFLSPKTVATYLHRIYGKLQLPGRSMKQVEMLRAHARALLHLNTLRHAEQPKAYRQGYEAALRDLLDANIDQVDELGAGFVWKLVDPRNGATI